eukprot:c3926_g1_i1.p1 GENE.c3926_g1_i1~~c3926_g1_i1.p1  ORF type:complete len:302 (-),score=83.10 c3926_g1_i1:124-987(-)
MELCNPNLASIEVDFFSHIGIDSSMPLAEMFGGIKCVVMSGSSGRAKGFAERMQKELDDHTPLEPVSLTERYHVYKVKHVLCVSHGIGGPSLSILLHELSKLLHRAGAKDFVFIRCGTCGGIGVPPGTVVITDKVFNGCLEPFHEITVCGKRVQRAMLFDEKLRNDLVEAAAGMENVVVGHSVALDDYYEAQARLDGAICEFTAEDREQFLHKAHDMGVRNFEMEGVQLASFCHKTKIPAAMVAAALIDRMGGDQVRRGLSHEELSAISRKPYDIVVAYLKKHHPAP